MLKHEVLGRICESGLIAVIRADSPDEAVQMAKACRAGGAVAIEITFTVPRAHDAIQQLCDQDRSEDCLVGAGTVLDPETARLAILSGAKFIVSPALNAETAKLCNRYQVPYMPGACTVREVIEGMECGAEVIKVFPGEVAGPAFVKAVKAALPQASLVPTGGVTIDNVKDWISGGCVAVGAGSSLTRSAASGDFQSITDLTKRFLEEIRIHR